MRENKACKDDTTLSLEKHTALSDTQSEYFVGATTDVIREVEWDICGIVEYYVETNFLRNVIACVPVFLKQTAVSPSVRGSSGMLTSCGHRYPELLLGCGTAEGVATAAGCHCQSRAP